MTEQKEWFGDEEWEHSKYSEYVGLYSGVICVEEFDILQWLRSALEEFIDGVRSKVNRAKEKQ